ncbi:MAG: hypothetical protein AB7V58_07125 [Solirubrobacterales bacterium]
MNWREEIGVEEMRRERPPRGAVVVVLIGVLACVVAALATQTGKGSSEAAHLEWVQIAKVPDSEAVAVPGGSEKMQLVDGLIRATGSNVSGRNLFQTANILEIEAGAPISESRVLCSIAAPGGAEIGHSGGGLRTLYPRSSESGIFTQRLEPVVVDFSSHGSELALLENEEGLPETFTNEQGVKVEWPEFEAGTERLEYLIAGKPKRDLQLPFNSIWRSTVVPKAKIACTITTDAGKATVETKGELKHLPPPIDEEAEEIAQEGREEEAATEEEESDEAGGEGE